MSRHVVNPARRVSRAFFAPQRAAWGGVVVVSASSQWTPNLSVRCVCRSMRPGSSVAPPRSMTRAPAGIAIAGPDLGEAISLDADHRRGDRRSPAAVDQPRRLDAS